MLEKMISKSVNSIPVSPLASNNVNSSLFLIGRRFCDENWRKFGHFVRARFTLVSFSLSSFFALPSAREIKKKLRKCFVTSDDNDASASELRLNGAIAAAELLLSASFIMKTGASTMASYGLRRSGADARPRPFSTASLSPCSGPRAWRAFSIKATIMHDDVALYTPRSITNGHGRATFSVITYKRDVTKRPFHA